QGRRALVGGAFWYLSAEMVKKAVEAVVSRGRVDRGRLLRAPAVRYPVAIPANLIDLLDEIGVDVLVRFQHFEETAVLDAFFHLVQGAFDGHVAQWWQLRLHFCQNPLANSGLKHGEEQQHTEIVEIVKDRLRAVEDCCRS